MYIYDINHNLIKDVNPDIKIINSISIYVTSHCHMRINEYFNDIPEKYCKFVHYIEFNDFHSFISLDRFINLKEISFPNPYDQYELNHMKIR
jgi:hypothetical protein